MTYTSPAEEAYLLHNTSYGQWQAEGDEADDEEAEGEE